MDEVGYRPLMLSTRLCFRRFLEPLHVTDFNLIVYSGSSFTSAPPEEPFSFVYPGLEDEESSDKHKHRPEEVDSVIGRLTYAFGQSNPGASAATNKNLSTYDRFSYGHSEASRPVNCKF